MSSVTELMNKLKQLPQERISQVAVVLLLIYIASILADITWRLVPAPEQGQGLNPTGRQVSARSAQQANTVDIRQLNSLNIFGEYTEKRVEEVPQVVEEEVAMEETRLNLTLSATVAEGDNSGEGTAIIESAGKQGTYTLGEKIESTSATLRKVYSDRVIIQNGSRQEVLMLDGVEYDNRNRPITKETKSQTAAANTRPSSPNDRFRRDQNGNLMMPGQKEGKKLPIGKDGRRKNNKKVDNRRDRDLSQELSKRRAEMAKDPKKLFELIRFSPKRQGGQLVGYRLNPGAKPELFRQAGFRPNDLAVEVNGYQLNDMQQAMTALKEFRTMTEANIVVERDGVRTEILFSLDAANNNGPREINPSPRRGGLNQVKQD